MNDQEIIDNLRSRQRELEPVELAELLDQLTEGQLSAGMIIMYFKRAFPEVPLRILRESVAWSRVCDGDYQIDDRAFNQLLSPWTKGASRDDSNKHRE